MGMIVLHHGNPDLYQALEGQKNYPEEISPGKSTFDASHETRKPRASTESWGQLGSTPWVGPWRFLDFTLPEQLETLNFGDCYDQNLSRLIMPSGVKSLTLPLHAILSHAVGGVGTSRWHGTVTPRLSCSPCCVTCFYGLHYVAWVARRRRSGFFGSKHRDFTQKKHGGSAPKMEI